MNFDEAEINCPHCGEPMAIPIDPSDSENQEFIEDCAVCCKPILIRVQWNDGDAIVDVRAS